MRPPTLHAGLEPSELVVDCFAGGGGASTGIAWAVGRDPDIAINHDAAAIAMHAANHPATTHYRTNVWDVDPVAACAGRPVGLAWFSPDCTHFSRAKGGKPRKKRIRSLAWVVTRWAAAVRPRVICVENVPEFATWGPLDADGYPIGAKAGRTFRAWVAKLRRYGYAVEWRALVAADFGAPTTRKRLFVIARCDGQPIVWPEATHGKGRANLWRTAAEVIDWSLPCPSIFGRKKPLAKATMRRIAEGVRRYVLEAARPFIVSTGGGIVSPTLIQTSYGERKGQAPRVPGLHKPLGTVVAGGQKHGLVAALLTKHYGGVVGHAIDRPIGAVTSQDHHSLTTATLARPGASRAAKVRAFLARYCDRSSSQLALPLHAVTAHAHSGLVMVHGEPYEIADIGMRMLSPRELFAAQGFPAEYVIDPELDGAPLTKTAQIAKAGNSVSPPVARAIVAAQLHAPARTEAA